MFITWIDESHGGIPITLVLLFPFGNADLRSVGLSPDLIICRSKHPLEPALRDKISMFCHVPVSQVCSVHDVSNIYHVPLMLSQQDVHLAIR